MIVTGIYLARKRKEYKKRKEGKQAANLINSKQTRITFGQVEASPKAITRTGTGQLFKYEGPGDIAVDKFNSLEVEAESTATEHDVTTMRTEERNMQDPTSAVADYEQHTTYPPEKDKLVTDIARASSSTPNAIRVKTNGTDIKSGFPYHQGLFDLRVRPEEWQNFTSEILKSIKFDIGDHASVWAAATATALTGMLTTSVLVGRTMNKTRQERKVTQGLKDTDSGLGKTLMEWNEAYFKKHGLFCHLELSEATLKHAEKQKDRAIKTPRFEMLPYHYFDKEQRREKRDKSKFVIVVTRLDEKGEPSQAMHELEAERMVVEMEAPANTNYHMAELPGDEGTPPIELAAGMPASFGAEK